MDNLVVTATSQVTSADLVSARLGARFGRMDLTSQLALAAVEALGVDFNDWPHDRVGICLEAAAGSLSTDVESWEGRHALGGLSPTLFVYTLPSAALGEIAIRHRLTGPNLCFVGRGMVRAEARDLIRRGEADACLCISCEVVTAAAAEILRGRRRRRRRGRNF